MKKIIQVSKMIYGCINLLLKISRSSGFIRYELINDLYFGRF